MKNKVRMAVAAISLSAAGLVSLASYEGFRSNAYRDIVGVPTIGYGETKGVKMGQTITPDRALVQLLDNTKAHTDAIRRCVKVPLYQHEFDAYVSFVHNFGPTAFCNSTMVKKLNAGDYEGACNEFSRWVYAGGVKSKGLAVRREKERKQCLGM